MVVRRSQRRAATRAADSQEEQPHGPALPGKTREVAVSSMTLEQLLDVVGNQVRQEMQVRAVTASLAPTPAPTPAPNVPAATPLAPSQPPTSQPTGVVRGMLATHCKTGLCWPQEGCLWWPQKFIFVVNTFACALG